MQRRLRPEIDLVTRSGVSGGYFAIEVRQVNPIMLYQQTVDFYGDG